PAPPPARLTRRPQRRARGWRRGRLTRARHRRERGAHAPGRVARRAARGAAFHGEDLGAAVVDDHVATRLVVLLRAEVAAHDGVADEAHRLAAAVVLDALGLALDDFVEAFALLLEVARVAQHGAELVALGVLLHLDLGAADHDGALGDHHVAGEHAGLARVVVAQVIGLGVHGLHAVGVLGPRRARGRERAQENQGEATVQEVVY